MDISNIENQEEHFRKVMQQHSDEELENVLKQRKNYQQEAARQAVIEAIRRRLINTEADLQDSRFSVAPSKFTLFPKVESQIARNKLWKSISRSLIVAGAIPLVWAAVNHHNADVTGILTFVVYGLVWIFLSFRLMQTRNIKLAYGLLILMVPALVYYSRLIWNKSNPGLTEILIPLVLVAFIVYGIGYLRKLNG